MSGNWIKMYRKFEAKWAIVTMEGGWSCFDETRARNVAMWVNSTARAAKKPLLFFFREIWWETIHLSKHDEIMWFSCSSCSPKLAFSNVHRIYERWTETLVKNIRPFRCYYQMAQKTEAEFYGCFVQSFRINMVNRGFNGYSSGKALQTWPLSVETENFPSLNLMISPSLCKEPIECGYKNWNGDRYGA